MVRLFTLVLNRLHDRKVPVPPSAVGGNQMASEETKWRTYEEVARFLLDQYAKEFGLQRVEGKQKVRGERSGTYWEIDAKGIREGDDGIILVECRRYTTSKQSQEKTGALAYRI